MLHKDSSGADIVCLGDSSHARVPLCLGDSSHARVPLFDKLHHSHLSSAASTKHMNDCCSMTKLADATLAVAGECAVAALLHFRDVM
jgi:hypothetical protein